MFEVHGNGIAAATFAVDFVGGSVCFGSISKFCAAFDLDFSVDFGLLSFAKAAVRENDSSSSNFFSEY
jgi:hypothetical protein